MEYKIPKSFEMYFWDTKFNNLNIKQHEKFIIERLLDKGDIKHIKWVQKTYNLETIKKILISSSRLSRKSAHFYSNIYNIPIDNFICLKKHFI